MALRTVRVPEPLAPLFEKAEALVGSYFAQRCEDPTHGTIEIAGERYVLVRAASLSVEFFSLVRDLYGPGREAESDEFARNILFDLAHALGRSDAQRFHELMQLEDPIEKLTAGPIHFAHSGWAFVELHPDSNPTPDESCYLHYDHPYSFEAEAWITAGKASDFPVCIMNSGYSSGWCEESFGIPLVASELFCRARGDDQCRFLMAHPDHIEERVRAYLEHESEVTPRKDYPIPDFFSRKRIEEELRQARDELEKRVDQRTRALRTANERLTAEIAARKHVENELIQTQKLEAVGRLATGIAHDFNNLMTVVIGHAEMLQEDLAENPAVAAQLADVGEAGRQAAAICKQLLAFGSSHPHEPELLDVRDVVRRADRLLASVLGDEVALTFELCDGPAVVRADRGQLTQVLLNLTVNARDALAGQGRVGIEVATLRVDVERAGALGLAAGGWVRLSVTDSGPGMDAATLAKVFDPFFTTKEEGRGTGLGLSTVYGIAQRAGGRVLAASPETGGARFDVYLPRLAKPRGAPTADVRGERPPRGTETVLVVEDRRGPRAFVVRALERYGYTVLEAALPSEAVELVAAHGGTIDLLLTDVVMPEMSGPELAVKLRDEGVVGSVLFVSGYAYDQAIEQIEALGAELMLKPFTVAALLRAVRRALDARV
jgi:signal transduction histidine kinase